MLCDFLLYLFTRPSDECKSNLPEYLRISNYVSDLRLNIITPEFIANYTYVGDNHPILGVLCGRIHNQLIIITAFLSKFLRQDYIDNHFIKTFIKHTAKRTLGESIFYIQYNHEGNPNRKTKTMENIGSLYIFILGDYL